MYVGLQVAVSEGDRLLECMQAVFAVEVRLVGCSAAMREGREGHVEERIVSGPHALIVPVRAERAFNRGSRAAVLRRSEGTCFSSPSDDEVGGLLSAIRSERSEQSNSVRARAAAARSC